MKKEKNHPLLKLDVVILTVILIIAFCLRLYKINTPLADFHSWRQADTAAVARNFVRDGFDLLHPKFDDLSNVASGKENPKGYRFVEFPAYNALIAGSYMLAPVFPIEVWGRLINIFSSLLVIGILYYFLKKEYSTWAAVIGASVFAVYPYFVFFSRVVLPEMNALAFAMLALLFCYKYTQSKKITSGFTFLSLSCLSFAVALLIKPTAVFYVIPLLYLFIDKHRLNILKQIPFYLYFVLAAIPLLLWRKYILTYPEGIPASGWLITSVNTGGALQPIFFRPAFFRWIFFERINNLILGGYTTALFVLGLIVKANKYFLHSLVATAFAYLFVFQGGNVQHAYYQVLILPALAICVGLGAAFLLENRAMFISKVGVFILIFFVLGFSLFISYSQVKDYYGFPQDLVNIAKVINENTAPTDKVVTDTVGDTTLLYLADRKGAANVFVGLPELKEKGYAYFITLNKDISKQVENEYHFQIIKEDEKFTLFKL